VEVKYVKARQELIERLKKSQTELQTAMAAAPDAAKIQSLVTAIRADQDRMAQSFKSQLDEELAMMTPVQQAQYLLTLHKWREAMMEEYMKMKKK